MNSNRLRESFEKLFKELSENQTSGGASVTLTSFPDRDQFDLNPSNPRAARIRAIVPNASQSVTLAIGKGTIFEIPEGGGRYTEHCSAIKEAEAISKAIVAGRFRESVRINEKKRVVFSEGTVDLPPVISVRWRRLIVNPFQRTSVEHLQYESY
jgi:hypothetical protein